MVEKSEKKAEKGVTKADKASAKNAKVTNKSAEIRKVAGAMKDRGEKPRPVTIIAVLQKQGIDVSSPQVSMVLKRMGFRPRRRRRPAAAGGATARASKPVRVSVEDLVAAKKLVSHFGGATRAMKALEALQQFEP